MTKYLMKNKFIASHFVAESLASHGGYMMAALICFNPSACTPVKKQRGESCMISRDTISFSHGYISAFMHNILRIFCEFFSLNSEII